MPAELVSLIELAADSLATAQRRIQDGDSVGAGYWIGRACSQTDRAAAYDWEVKARAVQLIDAMMDVARELNAPKGKV